MIKKEETKRYDIYYYKGYIKVFDKIADKSVVINNNSLASLSKKSIIEYMKFYI